MRYIIRKFVDASNVREALAKEKTTPIHDCYLKEGEQPKESNTADAIGFTVPLEYDVRYEDRRKLYCNRKEVA